MKSRVYPIGDMRPTIKLAAQRDFVGFSQKIAPGTQDTFHPFKVIQGSSGAGYVSVISDSILFAPLAAGNEAGVSISSLGMNYNFSVSDGNYVYLKCGVSSLAVSSAEIWVGAEQNLTTFSGSDQTYFHVPLARIRSAPASNQPAGVRVGTSLWTQQRVSSHLRVVAFCVDGNPAIYALPC